VVQHRFRWRWLVGFVQPASGRTRFPLSTSVSIPLFAVELAAFARQVGASPQQPIVLVLDRAGGHTSRRLRVPFTPPSTSICSSCRPTPPSSNPPSASWAFWPLTNDVLVNRHFASLEELEDAQLAHCVALQAQPDRIRSTTRFHWWPQQIHKRRGPRRN
jgi:hypothetical protein